VKYDRSPKMMEMTRLRITYSLSYDWLVRGRPDGDWHDLHERGLAYQAAARRQWEPYDSAVFAAFEAFGLCCWEAWPAYPVQLPEGVNAFKDPLTFPMTEDWDDMRAVLVHELCHVHEDHPRNRERYQAVLDHVRATFPAEEEGVQDHLITCTLQHAVMQKVWPERWTRLPAGNEPGHPILQRAWQLIAERETGIDWQDPLASLALLT
jgi:hypothetical protein